MKNCRYHQSLTYLGVILYFVVTVVNGNLPNTSHPYPFRTSGILQQLEKTGWAEKDFFVKSGNRFWSHSEFSNEPVIHGRSFTLILDLLNKRKLKNKFHPGLDEKNGRDPWASKSRIRLHNETSPGLKLRPVINLKSDFTHLTRVGENFRHISHDSSSPGSDWKNIQTTSVSGPDPVRRWKIHSNGTMELVTAPYVKDHPNTLEERGDGNHSASMLDEIISWKDEQRRKVYDLVKESPLWVGVGVGVCSTVVLVIVFSIICMLFRRRRSRCSKLNELSLPGTPKDDKPIYIKLSQLHRPKRSPNYVVTVLDDSNFSINSDDDSSEEELFDLADFAPESSCKTGINNSINLDYQNITSTPIKKINRST